MRAEPAVCDADFVRFFCQPVCRDAHEVAFIGTDSPEGLFSADLKYELM